MKAHRHRFSGFMTAVVLMFMFLPIAMVFANAFNADRNLASWGGFTTQWFVSVANNDRMRADFIASLTIASAATVLSLVIAVTAALWIRGASPKRRAAFDITTVMRLVLPEVVIAVGLFVLFRRLDLRLGWWTIVIGHTIFLSAYAVVVLQARVASMGTTLEAAAQDLGATPSRTFLRVTLPQLAPAVIVAGLFVFTFSLDNVILSQFLGGGSVETLPVLLFGLIRHRVTPEVNAVGSLLILITIGTLAAAVATAGVRSIFGNTDRTPKQMES
jgi:ABC-type spermidine/putrescine transport system permease subunit II